MNLKLFLLLILITIKSFSQEKKFSIDANYQIPADDNFIGRNYTGLIDIGLKYRFFEPKDINIGISMNAGILKNTKDKISPFEVTAYTFQPRLFFELDMESIKKLHPAIGIGYSFLTFKAKGINTSEEANGFNLNLGMAYDISKKIYAQVQYDFIKSKATDDVPDISYNTKINIIKLGLGLRL